MCYNCGCFNPDDDMGSPDNITNEKLGLLAKSLNKDVQTLKKDVQTSLEGNSPTPIEDAFQKAASAWGQSIDDAKKNTLKLLKRQ